MDSSFKPLHMLEFYASFNLWTSVDNHHRFTLAVPHKYRQESAGAKTGHRQAGRILLDCDGSHLEKNLTSASAD